MVRGHNTRMSGDFRSRRAAWGRTTVLLAGLAMLVGLAISVVVALLKGPEIGGVVAGVVATALTFPALAVSLWAWWRSGLPSESTAPGPVATVKERLAGMVSDEWWEEERIRELDRPMPVRWRLISDPALTDPAVAADGTVAWRGSSDRLAELAEGFRELRRRRLVVLGGPGAGKTTLATQLLCELLRERRGDEPVPVLLPVDRWDPAVHPRFQDWLAVRLTEGYPSLRRRGGGLETCRALVDRGDVLPVLDGLDEVPPAARVAILAALKRSLGPKDQLILTCRKDEYALAVADAHVLASATVIEPEPLSPADAAAHLRACLSPVPSAWQDVLLRLSDGRAPRLAEATATPLGLWLVLKTYVDTAADPVELLDSTRFPTAAALRGHLFDQLIPQIIRACKEHRSRQLRHCRDAEETALWLGRIADRLHRIPACGEQSGTRNFAWWHLACHFADPDALWLAYHLLVGVGLGSVAGTITGLMTGAIGGSIAGFITLSAAFALPAHVRVSEADTDTVPAIAWQCDDPGHAELTRRGWFPRIRAGRLGELLTEALDGDTPTSLWAGMRADLSVELSRFLRRVKRWASLLGALALIAVLVGLVADLLDYVFKFLIVLVVGCIVGIALVAFLYGSILLLGGSVALLFLAPAAWLPTWEVRNDRASTPMVTWRSDRTLNLLRPAVLGSFGAFLGGLIGLVGWTGFWLVLGVTAGLFTSLVVSKHRAWLKYLMVTAWLAYRRTLPRRLMPFLNEAHQLGLLRAVGPVYQFRHSELHDRLAAHARSQR